MTESESTDLKSNYWEYRSLIQKSNLWEWGFRQRMTHMPHMSLHARKEYLIQIKKRYLKTPWKEKGVILNEFCEATGMNRKYVIDCLSAKHAIRLARKRRHGTRKIWYDNEFVFFLKKIWEILDYPCGDRLKPILPEMVRKMRQFHELEIPEFIAEKLTTVSHSTIDVKLSRYKKEIRRRIQGQTKPGSLLKKQIPIRTSSWEETEPGFAELDTVAHCGDSAAGEFAITLNTTDILTGWGEQETMMGKPDRHVVAAIDLIRKRSPVGLKGIDPDNGSEFINWNLHRYCKVHSIQFTRGRPYKKNDNAHIEQKNWTHVRKVYGYARITSSEIVERMNDLNRNELRQYKNFFQPTIKLVNKVRVGTHHEHLKRIYDIPKTPYERILQCEKILPEINTILTEMYDTLNPADLRRTIIKKLAIISKLTASQNKTPRPEEPQ